MKKLVLYFLTFYDNAIRNLIILLGCFVSSALLLGIFYTADEYITVFSYARNGHIEDYVFISNNLSVDTLTYNNTSSPDSDYSLEKALESISNVEVSYFVANLQVIDMNLADGNGNINLNIAYPGTPSFNDIKQKIAEGRLPEARNEIVLCHEAKAYYSLGDTIVLGYQDIHDDYSFDLHPLTVKVVGFMPPNPITKDQTIGVYSEASLKDFFKREAFVTGLNNEYNNGFIEGFIGQPSDYADDGFPVELRFDGNINTCRATDGRTAEELCEDLLKNYPGLSESIITGATLKDHYWQEKRPIIVKLVIAFILSVMLFACFLIGSLYLQAREKSLEISILYVHGMTWYAASFLVCASYFPGIFLGMISGIIIFFAVAEKGFGLYCYFQFSYVAWTCLICLGISILCTIPIYIRMARQSPIEVIRKD